MNCTGITLSDVIEEQRKIEENETISLIVLGVLAIVLFGGTSWLFRDHEFESDDEYSKAMAKIGFPIIAIGGIVMLGFGINRKVNGYTINLEKMNNKLKNIRNKENERGYCYNNLKEYYNDRL